MLYKKIGKVENGDTVDFHLELNFPKSTNLKIASKINEIIEVYREAQELKRFGMWQYAKMRGETELKYKTWKKRNSSQIEELLKK